MEPRIPFHLMAKPSGSLCNMDCHYCFYLEKNKLYPNTSDWHMPNLVQDNFIRKYIESQNTEVITFAWQGGEPTLLGLDFYKRAVELQMKYANGKKIENTFQTNGILVDDEWSEFFAANNFLIGLSIDGPQEIHDQFRIMKGGQPSFEKVLAGLKYLQKHRVEFNTLTCVQRSNSYKPLDVYNFLKEIGSKYIQFIPIVERTLTSTENENDLKLPLPKEGINAQVADWSVEPLQFGKFLSDIFDEWIKVDVGEYYVQMFDIALEAWFTGKSSLCIFNETCGRAAAVEHNGDVYSCDHYVYPEYKIGNVLKDDLNKVMNSGKQMKFGVDKSMTLTKYCRECEYKFACWGDCPKHRFDTTPEGEYGLSYLCSGYKYFFNHINPSMNFMLNELKNERAPANVMKR